MSNTPSDLKYTGNLFKKGLSVKICIMATALLLAGCGAKDTCLDYGGHYNDATGKCEK
ncbi:MULTISPECIES: hypothetical protein [unclassified Moraxella]|uniref:hypothetical protein n=1 Tax=unclassified Moraxella TaxID=2685852 RepID=UPI00359E2782